MTTAVGAVAALGVLVLLAGPVAHAQASTPSPALAPAVTAVTAAELLPTGRGRLTFWGFEVYDATLWTARGFRASQFDQHRFVLELQYLRGFSGAEIARVSLEQMRRHGDISEPQAQRWQAQLAALLPAEVRRGDRITGAYRPGQGASFFHNSQPLGEVSDATFARLFFAIWLAPATSEPALRQALIAGTAP